MATARDMLALMPDWPAVMTEEIAASYCGRSRSRWRERRATGEVPAPDEHEGNRPLWHRASLDRWLAARRGERVANTGNTWD